jgi:two-component system chemotaxis response regulator CheB
VIGVVLTGALFDGTAGLLAIRSAGGLAVVQDSRDALITSMPQNAENVAGADHIVSIDNMATLLTTVVQETIHAPGRGEVMDPVDGMPEVVEHDMEEQVRNHRHGVSVFTCPECGGTLWQVEESRPLRFRCHVGHAYNAELLLAEQSETLKAALWPAVRTFREKAVLARQLYHREKAGGNPNAAARFEEQADQAAQYGSLIQTLLLNGAVPGSSDPNVPPA